MATFLSCIFLIGCNNADTEIDLTEEFKMKREQFLGSWNVLDSTTQTRNDSVLIEFKRELLVDISNLEMTVENTIIGDIVEYDWYYQLDPEQIVRIENPQDGILSNSYIHSILKNEEQEMIWLYEYKFTTEKGVTNVSSEWKMVKK